MDRNAGRWYQRDQNDPLLFLLVKQGLVIHPFEDPDCGVAAGFGLERRAVCRTRICPARVCRVDETQGPEELDGVGPVPQAVGLTDDDVVGGDDEPAGSPPDAIAPEGFRERVLEQHRTLAVCICSMDEGHNDIADGEVGDGECAAPIGCHGEGEARQDGEVFLKNMHRFTEEQHEARPT